MLRVTADLADAWIPSMGYAEPHQLAETNARMDERAEANGRARRQSVGCTTSSAASAPAATSSRALVDIHDALRAELAQLRDVVDQVRHGLLQVGQAIGDQHDDDASEQLDARGPQHVRVPEAARPRRGARRRTPDRGAQGDCRDAQVPSEVPGVPRPSADRRSVGADAGLAQRGGVVSSGELIVHPQQSEPLPLLALTVTGDADLRRGRMCRLYRGEGNDEFADAVGDLDAVGVEDATLREVVLHLIEECARHRGHGDLLRERIDGRIGQ
jgi:hypothetical protein